MIGRKSSTCVQGLVLCTNTFFLFLGLCTPFRFFFTITINCNKAKWLVAVIAGLLGYAKQAQGWEKVLSVPPGYYVELNFTMYSLLPRLCLAGFSLEVRDGSDQSANLLGEYCGDYGTGVVRSSGRYMWLKFIRKDLYNFCAFFDNRAHNETGMYCLGTTCIYFTQLRFFRSHF